MTLPVWLRRSLVGAACVVHAQAGDLSILLPLYSYPNWYAGSAAYLWDDVAAAAATVPITAIINVNNGPDGGPPNSDYVQGLTDLRNGGVSMVGYVFTKYGDTTQRSLAAIKADIDLWETQFSAHGIGGIFLDEVSNDPAKVAYYKSIYDYIQTKPHLTRVITNPGINTPEAYLTAPTADTTVIYENRTGWSSYVPDAYVANYSRNRFSALCLEIPTTAAMRTAVDLAHQRNVGYLYVTDDTPGVNGFGNPFDSLPSYWAVDVSYLASIPEPSAWLLLCIGIVGCALAPGRRMRRG